MLDTGNVRLGGLQDATLAKAQPVRGAPTGWICPNCKRPNSPALPTCFSCSRPVSPQAVEVRT